MLFFEVPAEKLLHGNLPLAASRATHARHQCFLQAVCRVVLSTILELPLSVNSKSSRTRSYCSLLGKGGYIPQCPREHMVHNTRQVTVKGMTILLTVLGRLFGYVNTTNATVGALQRTGLQTDF